MLSPMYAVMASGSIVSKTDLDQTLEGEEEKNGLLMFTYSRSLGVCEV